MRQPEPFFDNVSYIYELPLKAGLRSAFEASNEATKQVKPPIGKFLSSLVQKGKPFDLSNLALRMKKTPVPPGNYSALKATAQNLFFIHRENTGNKQVSLRAIKIDPVHGGVRSILNNVSTLSLSLDRKKVLAKTNGSVYVFDGSISGGITASSAHVKLSDWSFSIDPREEWKQMFVDAWRMERDYFYDRGLHGVDWKHELDRHLPLVERITDRSELSDLLTQAVTARSSISMYSA
jgi:tricorn protease